MFNQALLRRIPELRECMEIIQIEKGFSADKKYIIHTEKNQKRLLRIFDNAELKQKRQEFMVLKKMEENQIACSRPIAIGEVDQLGYMITSYIEGEDAEIEVIKLSEEKQFQVGVKAGKELKKIHQLQAPPQISSWYSRKVTKHQRYMEAYQNCGVQVKNDEKIIRFIEGHMHLMKDRQNSFQHDDYNLSNLIINNGVFAGVIDFNRYDWGDPVHEFLKIGIFSREVSIPFCIGQIKGYFGGREPDEVFWQLYSLYLAMCVFSTVVWTLKTIPDNLDDMLDKVYTFLEDHNYFDEIVPKWYRNEGV
ncbi:aminoglycoside phosphotransferase family protein [Oceanobacillus iheyensis]|uniref:Hypothetical conserved protein n=1 Tax=Oceanobacillus iheyensis (strain DSM 14371 / CIP 107618 / JCM 11309 / KCTC 3954 / HTE831) TaxID=221109 RepID=Q8ETI3_OCEIH|nr:aminoglycoside phosphotransferase family protein [Oceanobacillus iheyensis]BAC12234.1 hypothetical conserved protein [Oceanobacillus iheyensis HTE831]